MNEFLKKSTSKSERKGFQAGSEISYVVWFGGSGTNEKLQMLRFPLQVTRMDRISILDYI